MAKQTASEIVERDVLKAQIVNSMMNIQIDLTHAKPRPSSTGKTDLLYTTGRSVPITLPDGEVVYLSLNVFKYPKRN